MSASAVRETPLVIPARLTHRASWLRAIYVLLALAALGAALSLLGRESVGPEPRFRTAPAVRRTIVESVEAAGELDVPKRIEVAAASAGRLVEVLVKPGARVERGQILATLDPAAARLEAARARAAEQVARGRLDEARAAHRASVQSRERIAELRALDLAKAHQLEASKTGEARALGALTAARGELAEAVRGRELAELGQRELTIRAAEPGVVLSAPPRVGGVVSPTGPPLFVIGSRLDSLALRASVAEAEIGRVRIGQAAEFTVPAYPARSFSARVTEIQIEPERRQAIVAYPVLLAAENPSRLLMPGMTATVRIEVARVVDAIAVREAALRFTPEGSEPAAPRSRIWLSRDGRALEAVPVSTGISDGMYSELVGPATTIEPGAEVVIGRVMPRVDSNRPGISLGSRP